MYQIKFIEEQNRSEIVPFLKKLDASIPTEVLEERLLGMFQNAYKCIGVYHGSKLIGISGLWVLTKYYIGKHIEPDNVYILSEYQGKGIGKQLMEWIFNYSKSIGCNGSELNCYTKNESGQRFWESQGYVMVGYHYQKRF
ncbi:GNAT family N-acetyltransferase [Flagellimonas sp. W118]|uniref:GNAT family N-acetyltransferase n=1 Tax=Flagellimonas sp. W118 TaxID=3410791 RepID=UPI003BF4F2CC